MGRELWEIVRADELKVGDVMRQSVKDPICEIEWMTRGRSSVLLNDFRGYLDKEFVFRRVPDANWIIPWCDIVRRLAEPGAVEKRVVVEQIAADAAKLWAEMKGAGDGS